MSEVGMGIHETFGHELTIVEGRWWGTCLTFPILKNIKRNSKDQNDILIIFEKEKECKST